jgi:NADH dehydrogenase
MAEERKMKIVLTGATGFLGRYVLPALSDAGHGCLAFTRYPPGCRELALIPRVQVVRADAFDTGDLDRYLQNADAMINMVGILNESGRKGKGFQRAHVELVDTLLEACRRNGVRRFLQVSAVGAGEGSSHYLVSKGQGEEHIRSAPGIDATIVQPSVIFGEGDAFFNRFAGLLKLAPVLPLACPEARMQPVWAGDVAALIRRAIVDPQAVGETLVAVGPREYSLRELVEFTARTVGLKRRIMGLPDGLSKLQGKLMDFVPGKPFSSDNYRSLQTPNTSEVNDLARYGIHPRSIEAVVPAYLSGSPRQRRMDRARGSCAG